MAKKQIKVDEKVHEMLSQMKIVPREPFNDVIQRMIDRARQKR